LGNALGGISALGMVGGIGATIYQVQETKAMQEQQQAFNKAEKEKEIKAMKELSNSADGHSADMTEIEQTATDEYTKECAHCSGQLAEFYKKFQTLANAVCKEEYEKTMAQANGLVGITKTTIENLANNMYDPDQDWCIPNGSVDEEIIIEKTKGPLISQFGGCDWKCGTDQEFHQMMYQGFCNSYEYDNEEHRNLHQAVTCNTD
jgi:hypothetical protein